MREFALLFVSLAASTGAERGALRAGAARVDITPPADAALPMSGYASRKEGFRAIHDNIYVRAIVLDNGTTQAAIIAWELIFVPNNVWEELSQKIASETGIPRENLLIAAVHSHGAPTPAGPYAKTAEDAALEAVRTAKARLQPARFGVGTGAAAVNVNRRELMPDRGWGLGHNENGPSDKTLAVLRFDDMAGKPIAYLLNYPVHAVVMGPSNRQITGDLAGATSRFVEQFYLGKIESRGDGGSRLRLRAEERTSGEGAVAIFTSGAAGDQNPVAMASGEDFTLVNALGQILGEEAVRVAGSIRTSALAKLMGAQAMITCPGKKDEPVGIRLGLLMVDDVALAAVSGEVLTMISQRLKRESPFSRTIMVTHANGSSGYIPDDAAYGQVSYEITTTRLKPGCAENAIVSGFLELMRRY